MITNVKEIQPLYDFVLVQPCEDEVISKGGLYVASDKEKQEHNLAKVVAVGPGKVGMQRDVLTFTTLVMSFFKETIEKKSSLSKKFFKIIEESLDRMHGTDPSVEPGDFVVIGRLTGVEIQVDDKYCRLIKGYDCHAIVKFHDDFQPTFKRFDEKSVLDKV